MKDSFDGIRREHLLNYKCRTILPMIANPFCFVCVVAWLLAGDTYRVDLVMMIGLGVLFGVVGIWHRIQMSIIKRRR